MLSKMLTNDQQQSPGSAPSRKAAKSAKVCGVCGDRAKSYHFGGVSCDSCKAFFRRSVQNDAHRAFQCAFHLHATNTVATDTALAITQTDVARCDINMSNRKCCQFCRFRKCLDIGMEPSWVMTEEERVHMLRARMVKRKRVDHRRSSSSQFMTSVSMDDRSRTEEDSAYDQDMGDSDRTASTPSIGHHRQPLATCNNANNNNRRCNFPATTTRENNSSSPLGCPTSAGIPERSFGAVFDHHLSTGGTTTPTSPNVGGAATTTSKSIDDDDTVMAEDGDVTAGRTFLTSEEIEEVEELVTGLRLLGTGDQRRRSCSDSDSDLTNCSSDNVTSRPTWERVLLFMVSIQKLVKFARGVSSFAQLPPQLQVALLRANIFEMFLVVHLARDSHPECLTDFDSLDTLLFKSKCDVITNRRCHRKRKLDESTINGDGTDDFVRSAAKTINSNCPFLSSRSQCSTSAFKLTHDISGDVTDENSGQIEADPTRAVATAFHSVVRDSRTIATLLMVILFCPDSVADPDRKVERRQLYFCSLLGKCLQAANGPDQQRWTDTDCTPTSQPEPRLLAKLLLLLPNLREIKESHQSHHFDLNNYEDSDIAELLLLNARGSGGRNGVAEDHMSDASPLLLQEENCIDK